MTVTDADDDHNSRPFKYEILSGDPDNHFSISSDGRLLARGTFDMKVKAEYTLEVKVVKHRFIICFTSPQYFSDRSAKLRLKLANHNFSKFL